MVSEYSKTYIEYVIVNDVWCMYVCMSVNLDYYRWRMMMGWICEKEYWVELKLKLIDMNIWIQEICGISCIDMKFLTFWFEFEYDLKFTL